MKKIVVVAISFLLIFGITINSSAQNTEEMSVMTAKAYSMGGAFTGVADDVSAVLFNPAGLTQSGVVGFQGNAGISDIDTFSNYRTLADLLDKENIKTEEIKEIEEKFSDLMNSSVNLQTFAGGNIKSVALSANLKSDFNISKQDNGDRILKNNNDISAIISYGSKLTSPPGEIGSLAYGFNIKMTQHNYNKYSYDEAKQKATTEIKAKGNSIDLDFGVLAKMTDSLKLGAQIENLYSSGYDLEEDGKIVKDDLSPKRNMRIGASFELPVVGTTLAADLENIGPISESEEMIYHLGVEQNLFLNLISVRAGTYGPEINGEDSIYTAGVGLNLTKLHLDVALGADKSGNNKSGMISGRFKF